MVSKFCTKIFFLKTFVNINFQLRIEIGFVGFPYDFLYKNNCNKTTSQNKLALLSLHLELNGGWLEKVKFIY